jgi:hypothetical protein
MLHKAIRNWTKNIPQKPTNFTMTDGGILTIKLISGVLYLRWDTKILRTPLFNSTIYHSIICPISGTLATGETITSEWNSIRKRIYRESSDLILYGMLFHLQETSAMLLISMFCLTTNKSWNLLVNWVLLAMRCNDTNGLKWMPGSV